MQKALIDQIEGNHVLIAQYLDVPKL